MFLLIINVLFIFIFLLVLVIYFTLFCPFNKPCWGKVNLKSQVTFHGLFYDFMKIEPDVPSHVIDYMYLVSLEYILRIQRLG